MSDILLQSTPQNEAEYGDFFNQLMIEMQASNAKIQRDQAEIERLKAESQVITQRTDAVLAQIRAQLDSWQRKP